MTPTSLDVAGFGPAEGNLSSQSSSRGYGSQDQGSRGANQDTSFRQVMSSYSQSQEDSKNATRSQEPRQQPTSRPDAPTHDATNSTNSTADPTRTNSFIDRSEGAKKDSEAQAAHGSDPIAASAGAAADANTATAPANPAGGNLTGVAVLQMLLHGGSLPPVTALRVPLQLTGTAANPKASTDSAPPPVLGKAFVAEKTGRTRSDSGKAVKAKSLDAVKAEETNAPLAGLGSSALVEQQNASSAAAGAADSAETRKQDLAVAGASTPESLHIGTAEQKAYAALTGANNFAFAVRLTGQEAQAKSAHEAANEAASQAAPGLLMDGLHAVSTGAKPGASAGEETPGHAGGHHEERLAGGALMMAGVEAPAGQTIEANSSQAAPEPAPAAVTEPEAASEAQQSEPVRNVRLQLTGDNNQRVDIRLVEVGGEMRVSVHAGDAKLAEALQEHIPDLAKNLDQQRIQAEIWTPRTESNTHTSGPHAGGQPPRGDSQGQGQGGQQRQGNGRQQQNQPEWVDEFENYPRRTTNTRSN